MVFDAPALVFRAGRADATSTPDAGRPQSSASIGASHTAASDAPPPATHPPRPESAAHPPVATNCAQAPPARATITPAIPAVQQGERPRCPRDSRQRVASARPAPDFRAGGWQLHWRMRRAKPPQTPAKPGANGADAGGCGGVRMACDFRSGRTNRRCGRASRGNRLR
jgi:hypothetical protein